MTVLLRILAATAVALVLVFGSFAARAHDPGLSEVAVRPNAQGWQLTWRLSAADWPKQDTERWVADLAQAIVVEQSKRHIGANLRQWQTLADQGLQITLDFAVDRTASAVLDMGALRHLPRGHRQSLTLLTDSGSPRGHTLLQATQATFELPIEADVLEGHGAWDFFLLGVEHVLLGFDHLLFLLSVVLVNRTWRDHLKVMTSFTVGHSITLALAGLGYVEFPAMWVESLIALSIAFVAVQNLRTTPPARRWLLTGTFGLVHGLGFAAVLQSFAWQPTTTTLAWLTMFNGGVEAGQIIAALPGLWLLKVLRRHIAPRTLLVTLSWICLVIGAAWTVERIGFGIDAA